LVLRDKEVVSVFVRFSCATVLSTELEPL
jgi:hypothetical protein